jgi:hypothetical protein
LIHTAILAFEVVKSGNVGVAGNTGTVLYRSLLGARDLIARSLAEVGLMRGVQNPEPFLVSGFALGAAAIMQKPMSRQELSASHVELGLLPLPQGQTLNVLVIDDEGLTVVA